jgi:hypothetical protein
MAAEWMALPLVHDRQTALSSTPAWMFLGMHYASSLNRRLAVPSRPNFSKAEHTLLTAFSAAVIPNQSEVDRLQIGCRA